ncbi:MAG: 3'(2'),5'-bisphosphate nucleotidase CysQ [Pseudomonadota bacterium]
MTFTDLKDALIETARKAGTEIMEVYADKRYKPEMKADGSPVTKADLRAERCIIPVLKELLPDTAIISEENSESHRIEAPERFWLVDPLDGTKDFLKRGSGKGAFTVNIALIERQAPVLGVVFAPALERMFYGDVATGAWEITGNDQAALSVAVAEGEHRIAVTSFSHRDPATVQWLRSQGIVRTVSIGSSLKFCLVAAGEAHVYPRFGPTMEWDTAAGDAILRAAGGTTITPDGQPYLYGKPKYQNTAFIAWGTAPA